MGAYIFLEIITEVILNPVHIKYLKVVKDLGSGVREHLKSYFFTARILFQPP